MQLERSEIGLLIATVAGLLIGTVVPVLFFLFVGV
jgi:hypothetical protein